MVCPAVAGTNKVLDIVLNGDFADVLGVELVTNWDMSAWTGVYPNDDADGWSEAEAVRRARSNPRSGGRIPRRVDHGARPSGPAHDLGSRDGNS